MRLIDADALIEAIENIKLYNVTPGQPTYDMNRVRADELLETINAQPTAYDVEKVVAELASNSRFIDDINEHNIKCISCVIGQKTAIDIVKKGGVE